MTPHPPAILVAALAWLVWAALAHALCRNPRRHPLGGFAYGFARLYVPLWHGLRVVGAENLPPARPAADRDALPALVGPAGRPVIVVANHTAGLDPLLIYLAIPHAFPRFVMAADMRVGSLEDFWSFGRIIFIDRHRGSDHAALRAALNHLRAGGTLGLFPEGRIRTSDVPLHPFQPGLALLLARTKAAVLPVVITGTPLHPTAWASLYVPTRLASPAGRITLTIMPIFDHLALGIRPADAPAALESLFRQQLGLPMTPGPAGAAARPPGPPRAPQGPPAGPGNGPSAISPPAAAR
ncbi:MAG: hypothetical protein C0513_07405 [Isosphaera sp.]|nr:hypothetical protein [Isosphaera sp.]